MILIDDNDHGMSAEKELTKTLKLLISYLLFTHSHHQREPMGISSLENYNEIICGKQQNCKRQP